MVLAQYIYGESNLIYLATFLRADQRFDSPTTIHPWSVSRGADNPEAIASYGEHFARDQTRLSLVRPMSIRFVREGYHVTVHNSIR